jgi:predicted metalloprotease with PDZ domain
MRSYGSWAVALSAALPLALCGAPPAAAQEKAPREKAAPLGFDFHQDKYPKCIVRRIDADSPGSDLGLKPGDEIIGAFGEKIGGIQDLVRLIQGKGTLYAGDPFELTVRRGDEVLELSCKLRAGPPTAEGKPAKELKIARWGNLPKGAPLPSLESLKGKVVVLFCFTVT